MHHVLKPIALGEGNKQVIARQPDIIHGTVDLEIWDSDLKNGMQGAIRDISVSVPTEGLLAVLRFNSPESMEQVGALLQLAAKKWRG